ncbi:MAG: regulator [Zoogloeaceae bacterium]|nr:regulator [Zoogloeaceae bacterium]
MKLANCWMRGALGAVLGMLIALCRPAAAAEDGWRVLDSFEVGPAVYVRALHQDREGKSIWVGTSAGVHQVDLATQQPIHTFTRAEGLANEYVFAVGTDSQGYTWFGTNAGGASRYKDGQWKTYFPMHGLADYWIYSFANDKQGNLWIGTWAGVNLFDVKAGTFKTYVKELINEWVYGIDVDRQGRVWFGTEGGVSMFDGERWASWTHKNGVGGPNTNHLPASANTGLGTRSRHDLSTLEAGSPTYNPNYVFAIHVDGAGDVWAGTWGGGVSRFDGKKWVSYSTPEGLAGNIVYAIARDGKGQLWFGTNGGVSRFDGKRWRSFTRKDGLLSDNVYALAALPNGEVWAGMKGGVSRIGNR